MVDYLRLLLGFWLLNETWRVHFVEFIELFHFFKFLNV